MSEMVNKALGVKSSKSMIFGATLIDTNEVNGFSEGEMHCVKVDRPRPNISSLTFYPELEHLWMSSRDNENDMMLSASSLWINGFAPLQQNLPCPDNMTQKERQFIENRGFFTTDQVIRSRPDPMLEGLFGCFTYYGTSERLINSNLITDTVIGRLIRKGIVCRGWAENGLPIRYSVRVPKTDDNGFDYSYLIGGSPDMISDDMGAVAEEIGKTYSTCRRLLEEELTKPVKTTSLNIYKKICDPRYIWHANIKIEEESIHGTIIKAMNGFKKASRSIQGIFLIHNYLLYARKHLEIKNIFEYNGSNEPKKIKIDTVIDRYTDAYRFCKTLCFMFNDIAECKF